MSMRNVLSSTLNIATGALLIGFATTRMGNKSITTDLQEQVKEYNLTQKEYEAIENRAKEQGQFLSDTRSQLVWQQALDSLQKDAACKKAYLEGAQMVRDSIANASKQTNL